MPPNFSALFSWSAHPGYFLRAQSQKSLDGLPANGVDYLIHSDSGLGEEFDQHDQNIIKFAEEPLRMPTIASQFGTLAEQAVRQKQTHTGYLETLLNAETEERERNTIDRRIEEAHLPRVKTLEKFDYC